MREGGDYHSTFESRFGLGESSLGSLEFCFTKTTLLRGTSLDGLSTGSTSGNGNDGVEALRWIGNGWR